MAVVSQPDRRRGRGRRLSPSPVAEVALREELPLLRPERAADAEGELRALTPDLGVVVAFGQFIPKRIRELPALGYCINGHASLLPRWRGAAPVERAILAGDTETGVCLMEVAEGLDEGGIYAETALPIDDEVTAAELRGRLAEEGAALLVESLRRGLGPARPQVGDVTYAAKIDKGELRLDFTEPAVQLHRAVRVGPAWAEFRGKRLGIERTSVRPGRGHPGALDGAIVATPDGLLELVTVRPEGKRSMSADDWLNGARPRPGEGLA